MTSPGDGAGRWKWAGAEGAVLVYREDIVGQQFFTLEGKSSVTIGLGCGCDVRLACDERVLLVQEALDL